MVQEQIEVANTIVDKMNSSGYSVTNTRRRIIAEILRNQKIFTSEELTKSLPNLGRATIYRTLKILNEIGSICKLNISEENNFYTISFSDHHLHTICKKCNEIKEINLISVEKSIRQLGKKIDGDIISHNLDIFIVCTKCS